MTDKNLLESLTVPMTAGEWRLRLSELCRDCAVALLEDEAGCLGTAYDLMALAPDVPELEEVAGHLPPRARLEALLEAGAHDTAALALVPENATYILSRAGSGGGLASVLLCGMDEEMTSQGESVAMALLSALAACLAAAADGIESHRAMGPKANAGKARAKARCGDASFDVEEWQMPQGTVLH